jgi:hypothetical protein
MLPALATEPDPLFRDNSVLDVTITAPMKPLVRERSKDEYLKGTFGYTDADGTPVVLDVGIRARGNFRHKICDLPPLRLNFKKSQVKGTLFNKQNKLKLVVPCEDSDRYEQLLLREYLAYRILNTLTDLSFRVRLLRVTYADSNGGANDDIRYAFVIEDEERFAKRHGLESVDLRWTSVEALEPEALNLTSVFQYLIGNTDFSPIAGAPERGCCHNYVLYSGASGRFMPVPYDFDHSGLVDAPYAEPNDQFKLRNVQERLYRGRCANNAFIPASVDRHRQARESIYELVDELPGADGRTRRETTRYIDGFFELIEKPSRVDRYITKKCI